MLPSHTDPSTPKPPFLGSIFFFGFSTAKGQVNSSLLTSPQQQRLLISPFRAADQPRPHLRRQEDDRIIPISSDPRPPSTSRTFLLQPPWTPANDSPSSSSKHHRTASFPPDQRTGRVVPHLLRPTAPASTSGSFLPQPPNSLQRQQPTQQRPQTSNPWSCHRSPELKERETQRQRKNRSADLQI